MAQRQLTPIDMESNAITNLPTTPASANDAASKSYVDTEVSGKVDNSTISASGKGVVVHGATASTARPTGYASIEWIGSVEPTNATNDDTWINTA